MKRVDSFWANIYVGLRVGYSGSEQNIVEASDICSTYVDKVGLAVTITPTIFVYKGGRESGVIVGLINYPRFPSTPKKITDHAIRLAKILKKKLKQHRVSIVTPTETIMVGSTK